MKSLTPNRPIVESGWREQPLVVRDSWWILDLRKSYRKTARLGSLPGMIVDVVLWNELMKNLRKISPASPDFRPVLILFKI